jgi:hypothetical protein
MQPKPISENSPGPPGGGYGGDRAREQWKGGDVKKRWDGIADRYYSLHARARARAHATASCVYGPANARNETHDVSVESAIRLSFSRVRAWR